MGHAYTPLSEDQRQMLLPHERDKLDHHQREVERLKYDLSFQQSQRHRLMQVARQRAKKANVPNLRRD